MQVVLLLAGIVAIGAGIATLFASVGNGKFDPGHPLITAGTVSLTSGFLLVGLASVVARLRRIADALDTQPLPRSIVGAAESLQKPTKAAERPAADISPASQQANETKEPSSEAEAQVGQTAVAPTSPDQTEASTQKREPPEKREPTDKREPTLVAGAPMAPVFATVTNENMAAAPRGMEWPRVDVAERAPPVLAPVEPPLPEVSPAPGGDVRSDHLAPAEGQDPRISNEPPPRVLKSGVIEGMAYTLYSDGSVEAELPQGTRRFASIGEWRAHMREQA